MGQKKIWAFGGGKGGVGKSFVAGNLGILLAQNGNTVILADLDLGGANMHTWLGVNSPTKSISEFIEREEQDIKKLLIPTEDEGFALYFSSFSYAVACKSSYKFGKPGKPRGSDRISFSFTIFIVFAKDKLFYKRCIQKRGKDSIFSSMFIGSQE